MPQYLTADEVICRVTLDTQGVMDARFGRRSGVRMPHRESMADQASCKEQRELIHIRANNVSFAWRPMSLRVLVCFLTDAMFANGSERIRLLQVPK